MFDENGNYIWNQDIPWMTPYGFPFALGYPARVEDPVKTTEKKKTSSFLLKAGSVFSAFNSRPKDRYSAGWDAAWGAANDAGGNFKTLSDYQNSKGGLFNMSKLDNPFSKGNIKSGASNGIILATAQGVGTAGGKLISLGYESSAGPAIALAGSTIGGLVGQVNPLLGGAITAGSGLVGGIWNRGFGMKTNQAALTTATGNISKGLKYKGAASSFDTVVEAPTMQSHRTVYKGGWWNKGKANDKNQQLAKAEQYAGDYSRNQMLNNISTLNHKQSNNMLANYSAFGGPLYGYGIQGPVDLWLASLQQAINNKAIENKNKASLPSSGFYNINAFGGNIEAYGANWSTGLSHVNKGKSHEENPYGGVTVGYDSQGTPNMVEEGEVIANTKEFGGKAVRDYVFSDRLKVPEYSKEYKDEEMPYEMKALKKYEGKTFAEGGKKAEKESGVDERPNDPIAQNMFTVVSDLLMQSQEKEREKKLLDELKKMIDLMTPEELQAFQQLFAMALLQMMQQPSPEQQQVPQELPMAAPEQQLMELQVPLEEPYTDEGYSMSPEEQALLQQQGMPVQQAYGGKINKFDGGGPLNTDVYNRLNALAAASFPGRMWFQLNDGQKQWIIKKIRRGEGDAKALYGGNRADRVAAFQKEIDIYDNDYKSYKEKNSNYKKASIVNNDNLGKFSDELLRFIAAAVDEKTDDEGKKQYQNMTRSLLMSHITSSTKAKNFDMYNIQSAVGNVPKGEVPKNLLRKIDDYRGLDYSGKTLYGKDAWTAGKNNVTVNLRGDTDVYAILHWYDPKTGKLIIANFNDDNSDFDITAENEADAMKQYELHDNYLKGRYGLAKSLYGLSGKKFSIDELANLNPEWKAYIEDLGKDYWEGDAEKGLKAHKQHFTIDKLLPGITPEALESEEAFKQWVRDNYDKLRGSYWFDQKGGIAHKIAKNRAFNEPGKLYAFYEDIDGQPVYYNALYDNDLEELKKYYDIEEGWSPYTEGLPEGSTLFRKKLTRKQGNPDIDFAGLDEAKDALTSWSGYYQVTDEGGNPAEPKEGQPPFPKYPEAAMLYPQIANAANLIRLIGNPPNLEEENKLLGLYRNTDWRPTGTDMIPYMGQPFYEGRNYELTLNLQSGMRGMQNKGLGAAAAPAAMSLMAQSIPQIAKAETERYKQNNANALAYNQLYTDIGKANQEAAIKTGGFNSDAYSKAANTSVAGSVDILKEMNRRQDDYNAALAKSYENAAALAYTGLNNAYLNKVLGWGMLTGTWASGPHYAGQQQGQNAFGGPIRKSIMRSLI